MRAWTITPSPRESPEHVASSGWDEATLQDNIRRNATSQAEAMQTRQPTAPPARHTAWRRRLLCLNQYLFGGLCAGAVPCPDFSDA